MSNRDLIEQIQNHIDNVDDPNASLLVARKLLVRIVAALESHEWQDIDENTPRDGTPIILEGLMREPNMGGERRITKDVHEGHWDAGMWQTGTFYQWVKVFRWMPFPQPGDKDEPLEA